MVNGGGWQSAYSGRGGHIHQNNGRFQVDRRGAITRKVWTIPGRNEGRDLWMKLGIQVLASILQIFQKKLLGQSCGRFLQWLGMWSMSLFQRNWTSCVVALALFVTNEQDVPGLERWLQQTWLRSYKLQINRSHSPEVEVRGTVNAGAVESKPVEPSVAVDAPVIPEVRLGQWPLVGAWKKRMVEVNNKNFNMEYGVNEERVKMLSC